MQVIATLFPIRRVALSLMSILFLFAAYLPCNGTPATPNRLWDDLLVIWAAIHSHSHNCADYWSQLDANDHNLDVSEAYSHDDSDYGARNRKWMSCLADTLRFSELSLPGTHDTMARFGAGGGDVGKCQTMSLINQLNAGIRVLDIRCRRYNNTLTIHHGRLYQNANLDDVLQTIAAFLGQNSSEAVFMRVKEEYSPEGDNQSFAVIFNAYKAKYPGLIADYKSDNPTLGEVRGKIVVLQDFDPDNEPRVGMDYGGLDAEDYWELSSNWDLYHKWTLVKEHLSITINGSPDIRYITYLSGDGQYALPYFVASGKSSPSTDAPQLRTGRTADSVSNPYPDFPRVDCVGSVCSVAFAGTNQLTSKFLTANPEGRVGIIMADFPGRSLIDNIIVRNPRK